MPLVRRAHSVAAAVLAIACLTGAWATATATAAQPVTQPRLIVGFRSSATPAAQSATLRSLTGGTSTKRGGLTRLRAAVVAVPRSQLAATRARLLKRSDVAYVEIDHVARAFDLEASAASGVAAQWRPNDTFLSQQWGLAKLGAEQAWETTRGTGITVAVLDTGVDYIHPDLKGRVDLGRDFVDKDDDPMDVQGHGTHVSGIVAAGADDATGVAGVAPGARVLAVRVLDAKGEGNYSNVADGIVYAVGKGAKVINLSLGGPEQSTLLQSAVGYAAARGVVVTCASGNEGSAKIGYPAAYDGCTSIGATDELDAHPDFSNRGAGLDLVAPGVQIMSSTMGGSYDSWDGTSMAAPFASGAAALLYAQGLGRRDVLGALTGTAVDLGATGVDQLYGAGRIDAAGAVAAASRMPRRASDTSPPTVSAVRVLAPRKEVTKKKVTTWKVRSTTPWRRVGTTEYTGAYQWSRTATRGATRTVTTFRMRRGIVTRKVVRQARTTKTVTKTTIYLRVEVAASDDVGVDRTALELDGRTVAIDWSSADGWILEAPCAAGPHTLVGGAWDAADNGAAMSSSSTVRC